MPNDVHPQIQAMLDRATAMGIPAIHSLSTKDARSLVETLAASRRDSYPAPTVPDVENTTTGAGYSHVPVRIYRMTEEVAAPVIVYFHGGGHVFGSLDSFDTTARFLARSAGCTVVSVDYRMAPEHPFPAAPLDCYDAARWVADHAALLRVDPARLAVCGDSAGGNLATVVALMARDSGAFSVSAQALVYPVIDYRGGTPSYDRYGVGYGILEAQTAVWFAERYLPDADTHQDWRASPGLAASHKGLPPALVLTAECDILHDEGVGYAAQLEAAGVLVERANFPGMIHGFFGYLGLVDDAARAHETVARFLQGVWGAPRKA